MPKSTALKDFFQGSNAASSYKKFRPEMPEPCVKKIINFLSEKFDLRDCIAADVGCGSGQSTLPMATHLKKVIGIDTSEAQLANAKETDDPRKHNVEYRLGTAERLPLADASVHLIYCVFSAHWFDMPAFVKEADRVLIPGGALVFCGTDYTMEFNKEWNDQAIEYYDELIQCTKDYWDENLGEQRDFYVDLQSPYKAYIRDHSVTIYETLPVAKFVSRLKTISSVGEFLKDKPQEANQCIDLNEAFEIQSVSRRN